MLLRGKVNIHRDSSSHFDLIRDVAYMSRGENPMDYALCLLGCYMRNIL